jgi:hypothetical protein
MEDSVYIPSTVDGKEEDWKFEENVGYTVIPSLKRSNKIYTKRCVQWNTAIILALMSFRLKDHLKLHLGEHPE